jgi:uncharacterized repeat protein (TIGR01451 family)
MDGGVVGSYETNGDGVIILDALAPGWYKAAESKAPEGYVPDDTPQDFEVTSNQFIRLVFEDKALAGLRIIKLDSATRQPVAGVEFEISKMNGEKVLTGLNGTTFKTDSAGQIYVPNLADGYYIVTEVRQAAGYVLDAEPKTVLVQSGKPTVLEVLNATQSGLRVIKLDSITKQPIYGVEFMLFDSGNNVVGRYVTDDHGVIDFTVALKPGRYTLRETKPAEGYYRDDMPRTVEFVSGRVTEIRWENTPQAGQIQILKKSGDDNEITGLPAGTPLAGAVFEVYAYKSGNLVDRFVSGSDGRAVSKPLPLGRYVVKEVQAPQWYRVSDKTLDIEIEFATQVLKFEYLNYAANTGVTIRKTGVREAMPGDVIFYTVKELRNTSTVPLTDFFWRDTLPIDAVRLTKIVTGTYNQSLKYKILVTTNKGDQRVAADNLSTTKNNVIDCSNASLGLANDEYVTSFTLIFGTVKAGFSIVEPPQIYVRVLPNLANGYQFANKADTGGKYGNEWVAGNSAWLTTVYNPRSGALPRTGY